MASNNVAFTAIGIACIAAAGAGGYFALRQNASPAATPVSSVVATAPTSVAAATPAERTVEETEAVVDPAPKPAKAATTKASPVKADKVAASKPANLSTLNRTSTASAAPVPVPQVIAP